MGVVCFKYHLYIMRLHEIIKGVRVRRKKRRTRN